MAARVGEESVADVAVCACACLESIRGDEVIPETKWKDASQLDCAGQNLTLAVMAKQGVGVRREPQRKIAALDDQLPTTSGRRSSFEQSPSWRHGSSARWKTIAGRSVRSSAAITTA